MRQDATRIALYQYSCGQYTNTYGSTYPGMGYSDWEFYMNTHDTCEGAITSIEHMGYFSGWCTNTGRAIEEATSNLLSTGDCTIVAE